MEKIIKDKLLQKEKCCWTENNSTFINSRHFGEEKKENCGYWPNNYLPNDYFHYSQYHEMEVIKIQKEALEGRLNWIIKK